MAHPQALAQPGFGLITPPGRTSETVRRTVFNVKDYGAKGDGVTDDTAAIQAAITACAAAGGGTVFCPQTTYKCSSALTLQSNVHLDLSAGAVLDFSGIAGSVNCIQATGTEGAAVSLTANASAGNTSLTIAAGAESGFTAGDYVRITSSRQYDPGATNQNDGEIAQVLSTASGTLNLRSPLVGANYTTANSAAVYKVSMLNDISITGGKVVGNSSGTPSAMRFWRVVNLQIRNTRFLNMTVTGVWMIDVVFGRVDGIFVDGSHDSGTGYGVNVSDCCQDCTVSNSFFTDCRHATTITGTTLTGGGVARRVFFLGNTARDTASTGDAFDCHSCAEDIHFRNCHVFDSSASGFNMDCGKGSIVGCVVHKAAIHGIVVGNNSAAATELLIANNVIKQPAQMGIRINNGGVVGAGATTESVQITGNTIYSAGTRPIFVVSSDTWRYTNVSIVGNTIDSPGDTTNAIQLQKADYCVVSSNILTNVPGGASAIRLADVTQSTVAENVTRHAANTTGRSISVTTSSDIAFIGNTGSGASSGIVLDSSTTTCAFTANNMRNCTTQYTLSTGAGHVARGNVSSQSVVVASATALTIGAESDYWIVTGTTTITSINGTHYAGRRITLRFAGILTFTDGSNLRLAGNFTTATDATITLACTDGTNWVELARSTN